MRRLRGLLVGLFVGLGAVALWVVVLRLRCKARGGTEVEPMDSLAHPQRATPLAHRFSSPISQSPNIVLVTDEPRPAVVAAAVAPPLDDLVQIAGIGPKVKGLLAEAGITTFVQLSETSVERLRDILVVARLPMIDPTTWPAKAALAAQRSGGTSASVV